MKHKHIEEHASTLDRYEKLIQQYVEYWIPTLGLDNWSRIDIICHVGSHPEHTGILATTTSDWRYMEADVSFYLGAIVGCEADDDRLEYIVVHELCHILICEMRTFEDSRQECLNPNQAPHEERVVSNMAMTLLRTKRDRKLEVKPVKKRSKK